MTESQLESRLSDILLETEDCFDAQTFKETGVFTMNKGLVLRMKDGSEFQITIVRSARPRVEVDDMEICPDCELPLHHCECE